MKLKKEGGSVTDDAHEMGYATTTCHKNLYTLEGTHDMEAVLETVPIKVTGP
jgi:hypothetical protein